MSKNNSFIDGWMAHENGVTLEENPYDERLSSRSNEEWSSGWVARFSAIKHDLSMDVEDH